MKRRNFMKALMLSPLGLLFKPAKAERTICGLPESEALRQIKKRANRAAKNGVTIINNSNEPIYITVPDESEIDLVRFIKTRKPGQKIVFSGNKISLKN